MHWLLPDSPIVYMMEIIPFSLCLQLNRFTKVIIKIGFLCKTVTATLHGVFKVIDPFIWYIVLLFMEKVAWSPKQFSVLKL